MLVRELHPCLAGVAWRLPWDDRTDKGRSMLRPFCLPPNVRFY